MTSLLDHALMKVTLDLLTRKQHKTLEKMLVEMAEVWTENKDYLESYQIKFVIDLFKKYEINQKAS